MKHRPDLYRKEAMRSGYIFSTVRDRPLAAWLDDPKLLPKEPPRKPDSLEDEEEPECVQKSR